MLNILQIPLIANNSEIGLNTDILETGVVNLAILLVILFVLLSDSLGSSLESRKEDITTRLENARLKMNEAAARCKEARIRYRQYKYIVMPQLIADNNERKPEILANIFLESLDKGADIYFSALERFFSTKKDYTEKLKNETIASIITQLYNESAETLSAAQQQKLLDLGLESLNSCE